MPLIPVARRRYACASRTHRRRTFLFAVAGLLLALLASQRLLAKIVDNDPLDGLIAHWPLDEGTGSVAFDKIGGYAASLEGRAAWTTGRLGGAVQLDGSKAYLAPPAVDVYGTGLTLAAWVNVANYPGSVEQRIISKSTGSDDASTYWALSQIKTGGRNLLRFQLRTGGVMTTVVASTGELPSRRWFHAAATYDGFTMRVYLDGNFVGQAAKLGSIDTNAAVPVNIGRAPDGSNYLRGAIDDVRIYNRALSLAEIASLLDPSEGSRSDGAAPSVPTGVQATAVSSTQATLQWTASTDNTGVTAYRVRRNGAVVATTESTSYADSGLTASTTYSYSVSALDAAGNESAESAAVSVTTAAEDTTAPRLSAVMASGITDSEATISWTSDEAASTRVDYGSTTAYGSSAMNAGLTTGHSVRLAALQPSTTYHYRVTSTDGAGNVARGTDLTFTTTAAPNKPPTVALTSPASGASFTAPASITLTASASDPESHLTQVQFFNGSAVLGTDTAAPYSITWSPVSAGSYVVTAVARDEAGAVTTSEPVTVKVAPNQSPTVSITAPAGGTTLTAGSDVILSAAAADPEGRLAEVQFYAGATMVGRATTSPYSVRWASVPAGAYSLTAVAKDADGGYATSAPAAITVVAPAVTSWLIGFTASADHETYVLKYVLDIFPAGADPNVSAPLVSSDLGKPVPDANRDIIVDQTTLFQSLSPGTYLLTIRAVGTTGSARSAPVPFTR